jgi:acetyltransferase
LLGLRFANVFSVGNGAQTGVEEVLEYMDLNHNPETDSCIKLLYLESISDPEKLLKHASSLIRKGVRIAAIKAGTTEAGSRAAASHTGAIANPDLFVRALFEKAGIVYCSSRQELLSVASVFNYRELKGKNIAVITHAGGPAVMLTDALCAGGLNIPAIEGPHADELLSHLHPGSSVANPIDFLATGSAEQLGIIIDYCENYFDHIDAMVVIFGSPGLFDVSDVYKLLSEKLDSCSKPIYPILPSVINAREAIQAFLSAGRTSFPDEVVLGRALTAVANTTAPQEVCQAKYTLDHGRVRGIIDTASVGYLSPAEVGGLLDAAGIPRVHEHTICTLRDLQQTEHLISFPAVMKVVGPVHKTDVGGVVLNISSSEEIATHFEQLIKINKATAVLIQPMITGTELFMGVKRETGFGHLVVCGLGGIFIEVLDDFSSSLAPVSKTESEHMIQALQGYKIIQGLRGKAGVNEAVFSEIIQRLSGLVGAAPEIVEMDINPLMGSMDSITAVDTRIRIEK